MKHTILLWSVGAAVVGDTGGNTNDKNTDWNPITDFRYANRTVSNHLIKSAIGNTNKRGNYQENNRKLNQAQFE